MADYISREAAVKIAQKYGLVNGSALGRHTGLADCIAIEIDGLPAADVKSVRHGRWVYKPSTTTTLSTTNCSVCGWWTQDFAVVGTYCFCPSCGSKMDLEGSDA